jgi:hypothetical protein
VRTTHAYMSLERNAPSLPPPEHMLPLIQQERLVVQQYAATQSHGLRIPDNFVITAPPFDPAVEAAVQGTGPSFANPGAGRRGGRGDSGRGGRGRGGGSMAHAPGHSVSSPLGPTPVFVNPQTAAFCAMLGIPNLINTAVGVPVEALALRPEAVVAREPVPTESIPKRARLVLPPSSASVPLEQVDSNGDGEIHIGDISDDADGD